MPEETASVFSREAALYGHDDWGLPNGWGSITLNGQYYFSDDDFRPFIGAGLGGYSDSENLWRFGVYPRVGFDAGHFTLAMEYNHIRSGHTSHESVTNTSNTSEAHYFGVRIGGFFFGGRN